MIPRETKELLLTALIMISAAAGEHAADAARDENARFLAGQTQTKP